MSTSPVTSPKASPSNSGRQDALRRAAFASLAAIVFVALCEFPWSFFGTQISEKNTARRAVAPLVEQAKLWPMTYETAEAGKPVVWCVDHPAKGVSYLSGRQSQPLVWSNDAQVPITNGGGSSSWCADVVAVVEGRVPQGVKLRFVQQL